MLSMRIAPLDVVFRERSRILRLLPPPRPSRPLRRRKSALRYRLSAKQKNKTTKTTKTTEKNCNNKNILVTRNKKQKQETKTKTHTHTPFKCVHKINQWEEREYIVIIPNDHTPMALDPPSGQCKPEKKSAHDGQTSKRTFPYCKYHSIRALIDTRAQNNLPQIATRAYNSMIPPLPCPRCPQPPEKQPRPLTGASKSIAGGLRLPLDLRPPPPSSSPSTAFTSPSAPKLVCPCLGRAADCSAPFKKVSKLDQK